MTRGNKQINLVYENLVESEAPLTAAVQHRIYTHAKATKNVNLAAGLAKRIDTIEEIDDQLSKWGAAKIQASWYMRPGRDKDTVRDKILKEDRVTILEVVAALGGLDSSVYEACSEHCVPRVALALLTNAEAGDKPRARAATALALQYDTLSYDKRTAVAAGLASASEAIVEAFIRSMSDLKIITHLLSNVNALSLGAEKHILALLDGLFDNAVSGYNLHLKAGKNATPPNRWDDGAYPAMISVINGATASLAKYPAQARAERENLLHKHVELAKRMEGEKKGRYDQEVYSDVSSSIEHLGGSDTYTNSAVLRVRQASTPQEIISIINTYDTTGELDGYILTAALNNTNLNLEAAMRVAKEIRWYGVDVEALLISKKDSYPLHVIGALMTSTWGVPDELIEKMTGKHSSKELWCALISASIADDRNSGNIDRRVLESKYASAEVLPMLPFALFTTSDLPSWLIKSFGEYLEENLTDERAWDGFETLAKSHLGTVEQIVKAARLTTRKRGTATTGS